MITDGTSDTKTQFEFTVQRVKPNPEVARAGGWRVHLPHQCDTWDIAGERNYPVTQEAAMAALDAFIVEAQDALAALRRGEQHGDAFDFYWDDEDAWDDPSRFD